jgi:hypothetical protein
MHTEADNNLDLQVTRGFGQEWSTFRQDEDHLSREQRQTIFDDYFRRAAALDWTSAAVPAAGRCWSHRGWSICICLIPAPKR